MSTNLEDTSKGAQPPESSPGKSSTSSQVSNTGSHHGAYTPKVCDVPDGTTTTPITGITQPAVTYSALDAPTTGLNSATAAAVPASLDWARGSDDSTSVYGPQLHHRLQKRNPPKGSPLRQKTGLVPTHHLAGTHNGTGGVAP